MTAKKPKYTKAEDLKWTKSPRNRKINFYEELLDNVKVHCNNEGKS